MRLVVVLGLVCIVGCEEPPRFRLEAVEPAPHRVWRPRSTSPQQSTPDEPFRLQAPPAFPGEMPALPPVGDVTFANGVRVLTVERHGVPIVSVRLVVARGAFGAPPSVAALTAEMLFAGTTWHEGLALRQRLSEMGAQWAASASYDAVSIDATLPAVNQAAALRLLVEAARFSTFPADAMDRARATVRARLEHRAFYPASAAALQLNAMIYPDGYPYQAPVDGYPASFEKVSAKDLAGFWRQSAVPSLTTVIVVGDVDRAAVLDELHPLLDGWSGPAAERAPMPKVDSPPRARVVVLGHTGDSQAVVRIGWLVPDRDSPDIPPLQTLASVLGQGVMGKLDRSLRIERGESYDVQAFVWLGRGASEFIVATAVEAGRVADGIGTLLSAVESARDQTLDEHVLPTERTLIETVAWRSLETCQDVVNALTPAAAYHEALDVFYARLRALSAPPEKLREMAQRYLRPEARVMVVVGDARRLLPALQQVGLTGVVVRPLGSTP